MNPDTTENVGIKQNKARRKPCHFSENSRLAFSPKRTGIQKRTKVHDKCILHTAVGKKTCPGAKRSIT